MYRTLLLFFLLVHIIGDYYLQNNSIAKEKMKNPKAFWKHCGLYAAAFAITAVYWTVPVIITAAALALAHGLIDLIKNKIAKRHTISQEQDTLDMASATFKANLYCFDQGLHILSIFIAVIILRSCNVQIATWSYLQTIGNPLPIDPVTALKWGILVLFICKPVNITIKSLISHYSPKASEPSVANAGAFIGTLERIVIILLLSIGEYSAIGLVLAAKSVARYEQLKEKQFAEYYLLGTLLSTLLAVGAYLFLFTLL